MAGVPADRLAAEVDKILREYADDVAGNLGEIVKKIGRKGANTLKSQSRGAVGGTGKYAAGWTSQVEVGRLSATATIYNGRLPGLPHLLENGHAKRGGGRVPGRTHIAPVEQNLVREFESKVKSKL